MPGQPELPVETDAEIKMLAKGDPVPLDLLVRSNLVLQELTRLGINTTNGGLEKTEKIPIAIQSPDVDLNCRSIVNQ